MKEDKIKKKGKGKIKQKHDRETEANTVLQPTQSFLLPLQV